MHMNSRERRKHTRISINMNAELQAGNEIYRGKVKNISFSGGFIYCADAANLIIGETCSLKLILQPEPHTNIVAFQCKIIRTDATGVGIKLTRVDMDGYQKFKNLMVYNTPDPDSLLDELNKYPGLEIG
jgi:c-di-GMP-binding flagellar brake protein YcgR